ncbi:MAG: Zn-ribbon domain-containing OB-fold protein [Candidatus Caldarchaeum sp.]|uniref:Zn-ribbon domain-containing OB-fold protein n=1 Tax=Caldiarchaeum subterraneum TaxID=311458 RepID=A0A7C4I2B2_CALS0
MSEYKRPLPQVTEYTQDFWQATKNGALMIQECRKCGHRQWYPRPSCTVCGSLDLGWIKSSGKGTIHSFTVIRRVVANSPDFQRDIPFVVAEVDLDEGVRIYARVEAAPEQVRVGQRVEARFIEATPDITLYTFTPSS